MNLPIKVVAHELDHAMPQQEIPGIRSRTRVQEHSAKPSILVGLLFLTTHHERHSAWPADHMPRCRLSPRFARPPFLVLAYPADASAPFR